MANDEETELMMEKLSREAQTFVGRKTGSAANHRGAEVFTVPVVRRQKQEENSLQ